MSWAYDQSTRRWKCTHYSDLRYAEINNFAEYGQPLSPYEQGFDHNHVPDFANIVIEMAQHQVMNSGYGANITALDFPIVNHFLENGVLSGDTAYVPHFVERAATSVLTRVGSVATLAAGSYLLRDLVNRKQVNNKDRFITTNLYGWGAYGITAGSISAGDAAYIHGTVSFALTLNTVFLVAPKERRVEAEIGAGDDNWDFNSSSIPRMVNATVATLLGPAHYNLIKPIKILFRGPGKRMIARKAI